MIKIPTSKFRIAGNNSCRATVLRKILERHRIFSSMFLAFLKKKIKEPLYRTISSMQINGL